MSNEHDETRWSLPDDTELPRDDLKMQIELYGETILVRGFEEGGGWVRTVSADAIAVKGGVIMDRRGGCERPGVALQNWTTRRLL